MTNIDKNGLYGTNVLDDKMRTIYFWKAVEHILEMRKIEESYHTSNSGTQTPCLYN